MRIPRVAVIALLVLTLAGCTPDAPAPLPSDTVTPVESVTPQPEETSAAQEEPAGLSGDDYDNIEASISSGNTAALEGYLANPNTFIIAASECCGPQTPLQTISGLDYLLNATGPWSRATETLVAEYRTGYYVDYFPEGAFVLLSSDTDPFVVSVQTEGDQIVGIFIAGGESLLAP
jgi:predicted small lipoprotein YifL